MNNSNNTYILDALYKSGQKVYQTICIICLHQTYAENQKQQQQQPIFHAHIA